MVAPSVSAAITLSRELFSHQLSCPRHTALVTSTWTKRPSLASIPQLRWAVPEGLTWALKDRKAHQSGCSSLSRLHPCGLLLVGGGGWLHGSSTFPGLHHLSPPPASGPQPPRSCNHALSRSWSCPLSDQLSNVEHACAPLCGGPLLLGQPRVDAGPTRAAKPSRRATAQQSRRHTQCHGSLLHRLFLSQRSSFAPGVGGGGEGASSRVIHQDSKTTREGEWLVPLVHSLLEITSCDFLPPRRDKGSGCSGDMYERPCGKPAKWLELCRVRA